MANRGNCKVLVLVAREQVLSNAFMSQAGKKGFVTTTLGIHTNGMILYQAAGGSIAGKWCLHLAPLIEVEKKKRRIGGFQGPGKMVKKLSATYTNVPFKLQLNRNQLMVDTVPTQESVIKYSEHRAQTKWGTNQRRRRLLQRCL